ncbi:unnamed protein product [Closterium sp. NIES-53]
MVFSTLDLWQGFNRILIAKADKKKTAFHGPEGQYEWHTLPFGLESASAEFWRVMNQVLHNVPNAACYIDDVIVFTTDSGSHVKDVEAALKTIHEAGLTCHRGKCKSGQRTVEYLGFEVEGGKIGIQRAKVEVLDREAVPKDRSTLRALLGFLNYYMKFVPKFSRREKPLTHLLREDQKWEWGPEQEKAVQDLMEAVKNGTVLELPKAYLPFTLYTVWTSAGMGAVLAQMKDPTGRNARWAMKLQEYNFEIKHRPGKTMQQVDILSRNPPEVQPSACLMAMAKGADRERE